MDVTYTITVEGQQWHTILSDDEPPNLERLDDEAWRLAVSYAEDEATTAHAPGDLRSMDVAIARDGRCVHRAAVPVYILPPNTTAPPAPPAEPSRRSELKWTPMGYYSAGDRCFVDVRRRSDGIIERKEELYVRQEAGTTLRVRGDRTYTAGDVAGDTGIGPAPRTCKIWGTPQEAQAEREAITRKES